VDDRATYGSLKRWPSDPWPNVINDAGTTIGQYYSNGYIAPFSSADPSRPYPVLTELRTQLSGTDGNSNTDVYGLNEKNQVVGQVTYATSLVRSACLWQPVLDATGVQKQDPTTGKLLYSFYDLTKCNLTATSGTTVTVTKLWDARVVNDAGWIVGRGTAKSGVERGYLLTPK
jgi:hypothetical protein